jgi:hypothetical protein
MDFLKIIKEVYERKTSEIPEEYELLEKGQFLGSNPDNIAKLALCLKHIIKSKFIDLGSGDGRVIFTLKTQWRFENIEFTGIEYYFSLLNYSNKLKSEFRKYFNTNRINFIQKDFLKEDLSKYDIIFYHYWGTWEGVELIDKLNKEVSLGTILIIYGDSIRKSNIYKAFKGFYKMFNLKNCDEIKEFSYIFKKIC